MRQQFKTLFFTLLFALISIATSTQATAQSRDTFPQITDAMGRWSTITDTSNHWYNRIQVGDANQQLQKLHSESRYYRPDGTIVEGDATVVEGQGLQFSQNALGYLTYPVHTGENYSFGYGIPSNTYEIDPQGKIFVTRPLIRTVEQANQQVKVISEVSSGWGIILPATHSLDDKGNPVDEVITPSYTTVKKTVKTMFTQRHDFIDKTTTTVYEVYDAHGWMEVEPDIFISLGGWELESVDVNQFVQL